MTALAKISIYHNHKNVEVIISIISRCALILATMKRIAQFQNKTNKSSLLLNSKEKLRFGDNIFLIK